MKQIVQLTMLIAIIVNTYMMHMTPIVSTENDLAWSLIKNLKKDHQNVTTLESNVSPLTSSVDIANAFNDQFYAFFTDEDDETPNLDTSIYIYIYIPFVTTLHFQLKELKTYSNNWILVRPQVLMGFQRTY